MSVLLATDTPDEVPVSTPRKRNHEGALVVHSPNEAKDTNSSKSTDFADRHVSPAPSDQSSELTELTSMGIASPARKISNLDGSAELDSAGNAPTKKRKLTFAEREVERAVKQREKEEKSKQKAEEKARKEEEKRHKDEDRRKKEEEKETSKRIKELEKAEKQKIRDAEKLEKDAERARREAEKKDKEQEKLKKEKSQLRIGAFFGRPAPQSTPPITPDDASSGISSRRSSIAAIEIPEAIVKSIETHPQNSDFEKYIIPYFIHEHTEIAPVNRFTATLKAATFNSAHPSYELDVNKCGIEPLQTRFGPPRKRIKLTRSVREIAERVQFTRIDAVDVPGDYNPLASVPYKILSFREDVRPPYIGTVTKQLERGVIKKMSRRPNHRIRPDTNYDYDSEAEWEEPAADDEELLDDEMSESEDGEEEMDDFLDDENDQGKRRMFAGEMEPVSSGLCFEGEDFNSSGYDMQSYRMDVLHDSTTFPINPYSSIHWSDIGKATPSKTKAEACQQNDLQPRIEPMIKSMPPPRMPLSTVNPPNAINTYLCSGTTTAVSQNENPPNASKPRGKLPNPNREVKMIAPEFMDAFKQAINGSDLTKAGLIEILKKQFPKCSKDAIKDTLGVVAVRVGKKEVEKKWELV